MQIGTSLLKNMEFVFLAAAVLSFGALYAKSEKLPSPAPHSSYAKLHAAAPIAAHSRSTPAITSAKNLSTNAVQTVLVLAKRIH